MKFLLIKIIKLYQVYFSPLKGQTCRFYPTCSEYAVQALQKYGFWKGSYKTVIRLCKCHPFHPGGYDPV